MRGRIRKLGRSDSQRRPLIAASDLGPFFIFAAPERKHSPFAWLSGSQPPARAAPPRVDQALDSATEIVRNGSRGAIVATLGVAHADAVVALIGRAFAA